MIQIPEDYVIRQLLFEKFGTAQTNDSLSWSEKIYYDENGKRVTPYKYPDIKDEIQAEYDRLSSLNNEEITKQYNSLRIRQRKTKEAQVWFNQPEMQPVFSKWLVMPYWSIEEGVLLINNRDPSEMSIDDLVINFPNYSIVQTIKHQEELAYRYADISKLDREQNNPFSFILWANSKDLELPSELSEYLVSEKARHTEHITIETSGYTPPYIAFMLEAAQALELSPDNKIVKKQIEHWLRQNWPSELGRPTDNLISYMATLMRTPEEQKGGNTPNKR